MLLGQKVCNQAAFVCHFLSTNVDHIFDSIKLSKDVMVKFDHGNISMSVPIYSDHNLW